MLIKRLWAKQWEYNGAWEINSGNLILPGVILLFSFFLFPLEITKSKTVGKDEENLCRSDITTIKCVNSLFSFKRFFFYFI